MYESLESELNTSGPKAQYDEHAKRLLGHKIILAHILINAVSEFAGLAPEMVVDLIEGEPEISQVPVYPGQSNNPVITGSTTESKIPYEGTITYDVRFFVWVPGKGEMVKIIVDIEAQKKFNPGYDISARAVFYGARMLSAQLDTEFQASNYNEIKKIYTIWICMNAPEKVQNTITEIHLTQRAICGPPVHLGRYDLMGIILVILAKELAQVKEELRLHRLLGTIFSQDMPVENKIGILKSEYGIVVSSDMERSFSTMCNLSDAIEERSEARGEARGTYRTLYRLAKDGILTLPQAAERAGLSEADFMKKLDELKILES